MDNPGWRYCMCWALCQELFIYYFIQSLLFMVQFSTCTAASVLCVYLAASPSIYTLGTTSHQRTTNTSEPRPEVYSVTNAQKPPAPLASHPPTTPRPRPPLSCILFSSFVRFYENTDYSYNVGRKGSIYQKIKSAKHKGNDCYV